jgi:aminoglycoside phosphotransferase family enzyme/predicted kinase
VNGIGASVDEQRAQLVAWLRARDPVNEVATSVTHISIVAFQGDFAYKLKRAVRYPFIDLSTPALRLADCEREVALNRRLAPDVYLGIEAVPATAACDADHVVVMRRMPKARSLARLVQDGTAADGCVREIARVVAAFHTAAPTGGSIDRAASHAAMTNRWQAGIQELAAAHASPIADRIARAARRYLAGREPLFAARVAAGRARDGHGDLLADDVFCLEDGPRLLDCLEFDPDLRAGDGLGDVAFLAMDLERLDRPDLARKLLDQYRADVGDDWPPSLEHFWIAYRAHVRAKVAALRADQPAVEQHLLIADRHLSHSRVRLVLVGGAPATGKSTVARALAAETGWPLLRSDEIRKELAGVSLAQHTSVPVDTGIYTNDWTTRVYDEMLLRAQALLEMGESVILDATFADPGERARAASVASKTVSDLIALQCSVPADVAQARAEQRSASGLDVSDADSAVAAALAARFAPWPEATCVDTSVAEADSVAAARAAIGPSDW